MFDNDLLFHVKAAMVIPNVSAPVTAEAVVRVPRDVLADPDDGELLATFCTGMAENVITQLTDTERDRVSLNALMEWEVVSSNDVMIVMSQVAAIQVHVDRLAQ